MKSLLLFSVLLMGSCLVALAQNTQDVLIWGLYLDLQDQEAREAARTLSDAGYSLRVDGNSETPHLLLSPGSIGNISKFLRNKRKDGIRAHAFSKAANDQCFDEENMRDSLIKYKYIRNNFTSQFAIQQEANLPKRVEKSGYNEVMKYLGSQNKQFRRYLKQKGNPGSLEDYSWTALGIPLNEAWDRDEISFQFIKNRQQLATLRFDTVPGAKVDRLKAFEIGECLPYERNTKFKELYGLGPDRYSPMYYVPRSHLNSVHRFDLSFEKNKSSVDKNDVIEIINLLKEEDLTIQRVKVEGYASVEGSLENNQKLQETRAKVLIDILQQYNDEDIRLDTVITTENWILFKRQIVGTSYAWMDSLSQADVKTLLEDEEFSRKLEPFLRTQRSARLTVTLSRKLKDKQKIEFMLGDLSAALQIVCDPKKNPFGRAIQDRIYGILNYMELAVERGLIPKEDLLARLSGNKIIEEVLFYKAYAEFINEGKISSVYDIKEVLYSAQSLFVELQTAYTLGGMRQLDCIPLSNTIIHQLADVHNFTSKLVQEQKLGEETMQLLRYPDAKAFYPIILHHLYRQGRGDFVRIDAREFDAAQLSTNVNKSLYYLIKKIVVEGDDEIRTYVYRSDDMLEFDLWWLLNISVAHWEVDSMSYYDEEIDMKRINQLVNQLNRRARYLCPWQLDQLKLDFYLKTLHHYLNTGLYTDFDRNLMTTSFNFLSRYYRDNIDHVDEALGMQVAAQFVLIDNLYMSRTGSAAAYQLLKQLNSKISLSKEAHFTRLQLAYYHDPNFINLINEFEDEDWCQLFKGKYGLIPYGSLVNKVCEKCY